MVKFLIAHAKWAPGRAEALAEMLKNIQNANVVISDRKEHSAIWATRVWNWAAHNFSDHHVAILNDDLLLHPDFPAICEAMVSALPNECISLHTQMPEARALRGPWVRCYWYSGAAVILPPGAARSLLDFSVPWSLASRVNEDNIAIHWAWSRRKPFWCPIPAPVIHRIDVKSTLGYDDHPMRQTSVPWTSSDASADGALVDVSYWRNCGSAPLIENPWLPELKLRHMAPIIASGSQFCQLCSTNGVVVGNKEAGICRECARQCGKAIGMT